MSEADAPQGQRDGAAAPADGSGTQEHAAAGQRGGLSERAPVLLGWGLLALVVLGVAWVIGTGLLAKSRLDEARADLSTLRSAITQGHLDQADRLVADISRSTASAHALTSGPAWWVSSNIPVLGTPLSTTRTLAEQASQLGDTVLPTVVRIARSLPQGTSGGLGRVDLSLLDRLAPSLDHAATVARSASQAVAMSDGSWFPPVADGRREVLRELTTVTGELDGANRVASLLPRMLGENGTQRYFVGFMNEAEARGGGGIPGAFAIVTATNGRITFERFGTDSDLSKVRADVDLGPELEARYGNNDPTAVLPNSNLSPDFSVAARIWAGMWQAKTGERIDGALAIDPTALGYLLNVTGPAALPNGRRVTGDDIVGIAQKQQYALFPGTSQAATQERKAYLVSIAKAVSERLVSGGGSPAKLVRALSRAAGERRLTVWSRDSGIEAQLLAANWAGSLGNDVPKPYSGFVVNNAAGSKLDYYLRRSMTYRRSACSDGGLATATIRLTNAAPRSGLPPYVTIRADGAPPGARPGDNRLLVTYYADRSATITRLLVDGKEVPLIPQPEGNTISATTTIELPVGQTVTVTATVREPRADGPVTVLRQPGVVPLQVDLAGDRCR